jgi:hypothetical protein
LEWHLIAVHFYPLLLYQSEFSVHLSWFAPELPAADPEWLQETAADLFENRRMLGVRSILTDPQISNKEYSAEDWAPLKRRHDM